MHEKTRTKLAKFAKAAFRNQMELNDWLVWSKADVKESIWN